MRQAIKPFCGGRARFSGVGPPAGAALQARRVDHRAFAAGQLPPRASVQPQAGCGLHELYQSQIVECDRQILDQSADFDAADGSGSGSPAKLEEALPRMTGVDLTRIDGIDTNRAMKIISEIGAGMRRWKSPQAFCLVVGALPWHQDQRWQTAQRQGPTGGQPCGRGPADGGLHPVAIQKRTGRPLPPPAIPAGRPRQGHNGDCSQTGSTGLPHVAARHRRCR